MMKTKKKFIILATIVSILILLIIWIAYGNTDLEIYKYNVKSEDIPSEFDNFRIVQISDLHNAEFGENNEKLLSILKQADADIMQKTLDDPAELEVRIFERPLSGIKINGQKIHYFKFISSLKNKDCNRALKRILPRVNMDKIFQIINETPFISDLQKNFYKRILKERKERILDFSYNKL